MRYTPPLYKDRCFRLADRSEPLPHCQHLLHYWYARIDPDVLGILSICGLQSTASTGRPQDHSTFKDMSLQRKGPYRSSQDTPSNDLSFNIVRHGPIPCNLALPAIKPQCCPRNSQQPASRNDQTTAASVWHRTRHPAPSDGPTGSRARL